VVLVLRLNDELALFEPFLDMVILVFLVTVPSGDVTVKVTNVVDPTAASVIAPDAEPLLIGTVVPLAVIVIVAFASDAVGVTVTEVVPELKEVE